MSNVIDLRHITDETEVHLSMWLTFHWSWPDGGWQPVPRTVPDLMHTRLCKQHDDCMVHTFEMAGVPA
jgi:hypothetical protein